MGGQVYINRKQELFLAKLLEGKIIPDGDEFFKYIDGWTDIKFLEILQKEFPDSGLNIHHVANYRREIWGQVRNPKSKKYTDQEVSDIVLRLVEWAEKRTRDPFKL